MNICTRVLAPRTAVTHQWCMARRCARGFFQPSSVVRLRRRYPTQFVAFVLLLIVLGNLSLTTFTRDWIGMLPDHDHLLRDTGGIDSQHHAHYGDALAQAFNAWRPVTRAATYENALADTLSAIGVVSLHSFDGLQPELNTYTSTGLQALAGLWVFPRCGIRIAAGRFFFRRRSAPAPLLTPPRSV